MRNTTDLNKAADTLAHFFETHGFPAPKFPRLRIGPVVRKDEVEYIREIGLLEPFRVTLAVAAQSGDGSRPQLRNEFFKADGRVATRITSLGGWLDHGPRDLVAPPALLQAMERTEDLQDLPSLNA